MVDSPRTIWHREDAELIRMSSVEGAALSEPCEVRVLAETSEMLLVEVKMGVESPPHVHGHESVGYIVSGRVRTIIDGKASDLAPGDGFFHPAGAEHQMIALESPSVWLEIKHPPVRTWPSGSQE